MEISIKHQYSTNIPTSFRYFKLTFIKTDRNRNYLQLSEFNFLDNNMNKFNWNGLAKLIQVDGYCSMTETFDKIIDGDVHTKFCGYTPDPDNDYVWWGIFDLSETNIIDTIEYPKFCWYNANDTSSMKDRRVFKMKIEFSNDLETWFTAADIDNLDTTAENFKLAYVGDINMIQSS